MCISYGDKDMYDRHYNDTMYDHPPNKTSANATQDGPLQQPFDGSFSSKPRQKRRAFLHPLSTPSQRRLERVKHRRAAAVRAVLRQREMQQQHVGKRSKRSLLFRCNTTMIYGLEIYDIYGQVTIKANRCCCPEFQGELFILHVTIDTPWNNALADDR